MIQAERPASAGGAERHRSLRHLERTGAGEVALFLGGTFAAASDGGTRELLDPATDEAYAAGRRLSLEEALAVALAADPGIA